MADLEARFAALEAEVGRLRDHLAIMQIISRYGPLVDSTVDDETRLKVGAYFGEGTYDLGDDPARQYTGAQAIAENLKSEVHRDLIAQGSTHVMSLPYVLVEGDRATAVAYSHVYRNQHDGSFKVWRAAANYWQFAREDGRWVIVRRTNRLMDGSAAPHALLRHIDDTSVPA